MPKNKTTFFLLAQTDESSIAKCITMSISTRSTLQHLITRCSTKLSTFINNVEMSISNLHNSTSDMKVLSMNDVKENDVIIASEVNFN